MADNEGGSEQDDISFLRTVNIFFTFTSLLVIVEVKDEEKRIVVN
jgi:hypothetical protein